MRDSENKRRRKEREKGRERDAERGRDRERGRRKGKEGVAERVTEKDCATDGDMESQGKEGAGVGVWEGLGGGAQGPESRCRVREEGRQVRGGGWQEGEACYRGDFSHPRWPWLLQGVERRGWYTGKLGAESQGPGGPYPRPPWHMSPRVTRGPEARWVWQCHPEG